MGVDSKVNRRFPSKNLEFSMVNFRKASPTEIREEYERLTREKEERRLQQLTNPKGNITLHVNCTDIFNSYETDYE